MFFFRYLKEYTFVPQEVLESFQDWNTYHLIPFCCAPPLCTSAFPNMLLSKGHPYLLLNRSSQTLASNRHGIQMCFTYSQVKLILVVLQLQVLCLKAYKWTVILPILSKEWMHFGQ